MDPFALGISDFFYDRGWDLAGDILGNLSDGVGTFLEENGVLAPFLLLFLEEAGFPLPLPGDVMVMFAGYQVSQEALAWWQALLGCIAVVAGGSSVLYWTARRFGAQLLERWGERVHCPPSRIEAVRPYMERYGALAIIFGRHVPGLRVPITLFAGILKFPYPIFVLSVALSTAGWAALFLYVGFRLGPGVHVLTHPHARIWIAAALVAVGLGAGLLWWRHRPAAPRRIVPA